MALRRGGHGRDRDEPVGRIVVGLPPTIGRQLTLPLVEGFASRMPKARLAIVEGFSTHIVEWITGGRVDLGVVYNPEAQPSIEIAPVLEEMLHLVEAAPRHEAGMPQPAPPHRRVGAPLPMHELPRHRLIVPERLHALRRLIETRAALAGVQARHRLGGVERAVDHRHGVRRPRLLPC